MEEEEGDRYNRWSLGAVAPDLMMNESLYFAAARIMGFNLNQENAINKCRLHEKQI